MVLDKTQYILALHHISVWQLEIVPYLEHNQSEIKKKNNKYHNIHSIHSILLMYFQLPELSLLSVYCMDDGVRS